MTCIKRLYKIIVTAGLVFLLTPPAVRAAEDCASWVARAVSLQGNVTFQTAGHSTWKPVKPEARFCTGDRIRISENSRAALVLKNGSVVRLDEKTIVTVTDKKKPSKTLLFRLIEGAAHFFSRVPHSLDVATPFVNCAVESTEFFVRVEQDKTIFSVFRGRVKTFNDAGEQMLADGQTIVATKDRAPAMMVVEQPRNAVHWALYYPPVSLDGGSAHQKEIQRAGEFLHLGRVADAEKILDQVIKTDPANADALALQAIIALTQNQKDRAKTLTEKALANHPASPAVKMAQGYVQQAFFDIDGARATMASVVTDHPDNALAWARLSELWLAGGHIKNTLFAAQKAAALSPDLSRTQTVLGFAYLAKVDTASAEKAFLRAIHLDQADPLPRLGLGLARIRGGDLVKGREQIEIAAGLDPGNALVRSYLGKAFYEEKNNHMAGRQYEVAKELDPNDPTPWFYDAIRKQTENRPVEAFFDLQESIDKNDHRAVYRSKLLIDDDLAARSASLGRIYGDLGFGQLALAEGWKSVNTEPANHSAHRLLADTYATLPRHDIARVSELLQAQMLAPLNLTPIQPELAEANLFILKDAGPSNLSFNEYNSLFNRNRFAFQGSGMIGSNNTAGEDLVVSGVWNRWSLSAGQFHYETDGFRENNDQDRDIANLFSQYQLGSDTSLQMEYRHDDFDRGDLLLLFDPDNFLENLRWEQQTDSIRLGGRHRFSERGILLANLAYADTTFEWPGLIETDGEGYSAEVQHLFRSNRFRVVSGGGYFRQDQKETDIFIDQTLTRENTIRHTNLYTYGNIAFPEKITWMVGASGDFFKGPKNEKDQFNPKIGLTWEIQPATTLRAAYFKTLKRNLLNNQTLEPTQVAGFNQFFDDSEGTEADRYGVGIDHRFSRFLAAGAEWSRRELTVPGEVFGPTGSSIVTLDMDETAGRSYLYWTPTEQIATALVYLYEQFERPPEGMLEEQFTDLTTHRFSLGLRYFLPCGFYAGVTPAYVLQKGQFIDKTRPGGPPDFVFATKKEDDHFVVVDANIGYRLPNRWGTIEITANNLFDETFNFQDTSPASPDISPERQILFHLTLAY